MTIIDVHAHILSEDRSTYPRKPLGGKQSQWASERPIDAEGLLRAMDAAGVDKAVAVQASTAYGYDNSYVLASAARWPDRLCAVGTFDPLADNPRQELQRLLDQGLAGVRLFTVGSTLSTPSTAFASDAADAFWSAAAELHVPVSVQLRLRQTAGEILRVLERFSTVTILLDHCGYPDLSVSAGHVDKDLHAIARHSNAHLKLTHRVFDQLTGEAEAPSSYLAELVECFGSDRIHWGSNFPAAPDSLERLVQIAVDALDTLGPLDKAAILGESALSVYPVMRSRH